MKSSEVDIICLGEGTNLDGWEPILAYLSEYGLSSTVYRNHDEIQSSCQLGLILGYNRIVPESILNTGSYVVFHSSDLPEGRGMAPIYYTIAHGNDLHQTLFFANAEIDKGNIIAKASYPLDGIETEAEVRALDDALTCALLKSTLNRLIKKELAGYPQPEGNFDWWPRRRPTDSEVSFESSLPDIYNQLRAVPSGAPIFFHHNGRKFTLELSAEGELEIDESRISLKLFE